MGDTGRSVIEVSVLTPSYGYGRFIRDGILSVLGQPGIATEHIVQDGGSTDETVATLEEFGSAVRWTSEPDNGQSHALNKALALANGRWIAWLNADDFYLPEALEMLVSEGDRSGADVVYGDTVFVDEQGNFERLAPAHRFSERVLREYGCFISSVSTIFRRSILGEDPWDPSIRKIMDWDVFMRIAEGGGRFCYVAYPAGVFRRHSEQVTAGPNVPTEEANLTSAKFGLPEDSVERWRASRLGRRMRYVLKFASGGYLRQILARSFRGAEMRWFESGDSLNNYAAMLRKCYGRRALASFAARRDRAPGDFPGA